LFTSDLATGFICENFDPKLHKEKFSICGWEYMWEKYRHQPVGCGFANGVAAILHVGNSGIFPMGDSLGGLGVHMVEDVKRVKTWQDSYRHVGMSGLANSWAVVCWWVSRVSLQARVGLTGFNTSLSCWAAFWIGQQCPGLLVTGKIRLGSREWRGSANIVVIISALGASASDGKSICKTVLPKEKKGGVVGMVLTAVT
jgi:hypothetical protein